MALIYINNVEEDVRIGLWRMDEEPEELYDHYPHLRHLTMPFRNITRQKEFLCVRALLMEMTANERLTIGHADSGRPVVEGWHVSISHTRGYAVLMLSRTKAVGVDIEYRSDRIRKIASHFIRTDEDASTTDEMLALWCAKETLYKLHSPDDLHYFDMRKTGGGDGWMSLENMNRGEKVTIHATLTPEYCLTWATDDGQAET